MISEKKISYRQISKEKRSCKELPCKKNCLLTEKNIFQSGRCWKKISQYYCMSGKNFCHQSFWGKKFLPKPNHPYPYAPPPPFPLKSQMFDPAKGRTVIKRSNAYRRCLSSGEKLEAKNYQLWHVLIHSITCR